MTCYYITNTSMEPVEKSSHFQFCWSFVMSRNICRPGARCPSPDRLSPGWEHVKGILLHGPPGCGETLMARQIGKTLNAREPEIVNGPEILNKSIGGAASGSCLQTLRNRRGWGAFTVWSHMHMSVYTGLYSNQSFIIRQIMLTHV